MIFLHLSLVKIHKSMWGLKETGSQKLGVERSLSLILFLYVILALATSTNFVKVSGNT